MSLRVLTALLALLPLACGPSSPESHSIPHSPIVLVFSPTPGAVLTEESLSVSGRVTTRGGLSELTWQLDEGADQELAFEHGATEHRFTFTAPLSEGGHTLRLRAVDGLGQVGTATVHLSREVPPVPDTVKPQLLLLAPAVGQSVTALRVRVEGQATDDRELTSLTWALNGAEPRALDVAAVGAGGAFSFEVTPRLGANSLVLRATDASGNTAETAAAFHLGSRSGCGALHSGVLRDGHLYTWGRNNRGQLGLGISVTADQKRPVKVPDFEGVAAMAFNQNHSMALKEDSTAWTWGENARGQLGLGTPPEPGQPHTPDLTPRSSPTRVPGLEGAVAIALGFHHALVLLEDGTVRAFGDNADGQLGDGSAEALRDYPVAVVGLTNVVKVVAGSMHSVALRRDGTVWAWGRNSFGNLGQGTTDADPHPTPVQVPGLTEVMDIASGKDHILALHTDGTVASWGLDASGQLGFGEALPDEESATPLKVKHLTDARAVFANGNMSYAQRADGTLSSWGQNGSGQLGNGGLTDTNVPTPSVLGLTGLSTMAAGAAHVVAIRNDGYLFAWGWNSRGSLGREDLLNNWEYPEPIQVTLP